MAENCPNLRKEMDIPIKQVKGTLTRINLKKLTLRHFIIKLSQTKRPNTNTFFLLKTAWEKETVKFKEVSIRVSVDFSPETLQVKWSQMAYLKCWKTRNKQKSPNWQPSILYPDKMSIRDEEETKTFPDKQRLREFITTRPAPQKCKRESFRLKWNDSRQQYKTIWL